MRGFDYFQSTAVENLVGFSQASPDIFKAHDYEPVKDLKHLVQNKDVRSRYPWQDWNLTYERC